MSWSIEPDRFGVPGNMFGAVPDDFYGAMGRIVNLGAMVEHKLCLLVMALGGLEEDVVAGEQMGDLTKRFDKVAGKRTLPADMITARVDAEQVMFARNAMVHSLWPSPTAADARGWRGIPKRFRVEDGPHIEWTMTDAVGMRDLIVRLVRVIGALDRCRRLVTIPPGHLSAQ